MKSTLILPGLLALASASPVARRASGAIDDATILNYALTLEHLEDTFYREGLANYSLTDFTKAGFTETFYNNIKETSLDETTHVAFLTSALTAAGAKPVAACTYDFGVTDVTSFIKTASILEGVGVSAYLGAAADIMSKTYLTAAGSILTVEARHNSYIRAGLKELPYPQPFDAPLTLDDVYSLAAPFITGCPSSNVALPVKAFPTLTASGPSPILAGSTVTLATTGYAVKGTGALYAAFVTVTGPIFVDATPVAGGYSVVIPKGVNGQTYVLLTACDTAVNDDTTIAIGIVEIDNPVFVPAT